MKFTDRKFSFRTLSLALAVLLAVLVPASALGETIAVRIPSKIVRLEIPEMPDPLDLYTWTDSVPTYGNPLDPFDPCPILAVDDAIMHLQFSEKPDFAVANWYNGKENIDVNESGYAELYTEGRRVQAGYTWAGGSRTKEKPWFIKAGKDGVTAGYSNSGKVKFIEYTFDGDVFGTNIEGAQTTVRFEPVTIDGDHYVYVIDPDTGKRVKVNLKGVDADNDGVVDKHWYYTTWYVPTVTVVYPDGNGITKVVANYWNNKNGTIRDLTVYYAPKGTYSCSAKVRVTSEPDDPIKPYGRTIRVNDEITIRVSGM